MITKTMFAQLTELYDLNPIGGGNVVKNKLGEKIEHISYEQRFSLHEYLDLKDTLACLAECFDIQMLLTTAVGRQNCEPRDPDSLELMKRMFEDWPEGKMRIIFNFINDGWQSLYFVNADLDKKTGTSTRFTAPERNKTFCTMTPCLDIHDFASCQSFGYYGDVKEDGQPEELSLYIFHNSQGKDITIS